MILHCILIIPLFSFIVFRFLPHSLFFFSLYFIFQLFSFCLKKRATLHRLSCIYPCSNSTIILLSLWSFLIFEKWCEMNSFLGYLETNGFYFHLFFFHLCLLGFHFASFHTHSRPNTLPTLKWSEGFTAHHHHHCDDHQQKCALL